jgi:hypothetical protein
MDNHIPELVTGLILTSLGILSIVRKRLSFGLFGGRSGLAGPLFTLQLTGKRAISFGICSIVGALIVVVAWLSVYSTHNLNATTDNTLAVAAIVGVIVAAFGLLVSYFFEVLSIVKDKAVMRQKDTIE